MTGNSRIDNLRSARTYADGFEYAMRAHPECNTGYEPLVFLKSVTVARHTLEDSLVVLFGFCVQQRT